MKKLYTLICLALLGVGIQAQSTYTEDFESYNVGDYIGLVGPNWTTWSNAPGTSEDAQVNDAQASSGTKSIYFLQSGQGGPQDVVLPFGGQYNTGQFHYEMDMRVTSGKGAYFNFQANSTIGQVWALECWFNQAGDLVLQNTNGTYLSTTYPTGAWFNIAFDINLNTNVWELFIDGNSQGTFANSVNQIAAINIYPVNNAAHGGNDQAEYWVDDVSYTHTAYTLPSVNAAVVALGSNNPATRAPGAVTGLVGQSKSISATVRNLGVNPITSFDLDYTYNGGSGTANVTGVNIASLGSQVVEFSTPATLASGTNNLVVTVSNVNGAGQDGDPLDDQGTRAVTITAVPAANKVVVGEEGTGTWCQWCPRGAIYMDYMHDTYEGYWAGIAVHNGDPMTMPDYDGVFSGFLQGYPSALVERGTEVDPIDLEQDFLTKVQVAPTASLINGAQWDANTRTLDVSVKYTFTGTADQFWRVECVLIEDSVTGTGALYNQSNAYANNAVGPMGGFETLPASVPAAQMNYNHVARALIPNFAGYAPWTATVMPGTIQTFNYQFVLPATWDENQIHIVGMLLDGGGEIDNGSLTSIDEAINNGFIPGDVIAGVEQLAGPDVEVSLFPNPTQGNSFLALNLKADTEVSVEVTDLQGRKLAAGNYGIMNGGQRIELNTANYAQGLYFVKVTLGDVVKVQRLVVNE